MTGATGDRLVMEEGRFARFERIDWWDQKKLQDARILVVGAGALGNEVIKNLVLLGVGHVVVVDMDLVEDTNLTKSVLFREGDIGKPKAVVAAQATRQMYDGTKISGLVGNLMADVGMGWFRWADVVIGAVDNREARVFINQCCAHAGRAWVDGGIDVLGGIVRSFHPPHTSCYECTMGEGDWKQLNQRRSCSLLARHAVAAGGTPTTPTSASVIGALQVQEVIKRLHAMDCLAGSGYVFEGHQHQSYTVEYPVSPDCPWHESQPIIEEFPLFHAETLFSEIWQTGIERLGGSLDALEFAREIVSHLECPRCNDVEEIFVPIDRITQQQAVCPNCNGERAPRLMHSLAPKSPLLDRTPSTLGLPLWDSVWARRGENVIGIELSGDRDAALAASDSTL